MSSLYQNIYQKSEYGNDYYTNISWQVDPNFLDYSKVVLSIIDITEKYNFYREKKFLFNNAPVAIWIADYSRITKFIRNHSFSNENESTIFQFYRAVGIPNDQIGNLKAPVKKRNDILHTNGIYLTSENDFGERSQKYLQNLEKIHQFCADEYKTLFIRFLGDIKVDVEDEAEATQYLEEDFIQEFGINSIIIQTISKIEESEYPKEKKLFYSAIQKKVESED